MCYVCDSVTPRCLAAVAPDKNAFFMCGMCEEFEIDEEDFPELFIKSKSVAIQAGPGLASIEAVPHRAEPRKRAFDAGMNRLRSNFATGIVRHLAIY